jgi:hypothetical protein
MPGPDIIERFVRPDLALKIEGVPDAFQAGGFESQFRAEPNQVQGLGDQQRTVYRH